MPNSPEITFQKVASEFNEKEFTELTYLQNIFHIIVYNKYIYNFI